MKSLFILFILIILLSPFDIRIKNDKFIKTNTNKVKYKNNIDLYLFNIFSIRIDIDNFLEKHFKNKNFNFKEIRYQFEKIKPYKKFIFNVFNLIEIKKISIKFFCSNEYLYVFYWNLITFISNFTNENFLKIKYSDFNVTYDKEINEINYEIILSFRVIYFILAYIINIKNIILNKRKGSANNDRSSNKRVIQNINGQYARND